jgi:hypothetical protein
LRVPLSLLTPPRPRPIATTGPYFKVRLGVEGALEIRITI